MPANTNGVYQDHSVPKNSSGGVGLGLSAKTGSPGMGKSQYGNPTSKNSYSPPKGHENRNNSTYK